MSRKSNDEYHDGRLINGYDYYHQAWVRDGKYLCCGHVERNFPCQCYGRLHEGEDTIVRS